MRIELDETALVRPSKLASVRGAGSAGSTTMLESPLEIERGGERQADQAAAEDDHVRAVHDGAYIPACCRRERDRTKRGRARSSQ